MLVGVPATFSYPLGLQGFGLAGCPDGDTEDASGICWASDGTYDGLDPDFVQSSTPIPSPTGTGYDPSILAQASPTVTSYPPGNTAAQNAALLAAITSAGTKALNASATPYLIPGTNSVYNPATGAITTAAATPTAVAAAAALQTTALTSSLMPIAMIGIAAVVLVMMMGKK